MKRVVLLIIDSLGVGYMEDVAQLRKQDLGANTLKHILEKVPQLKIPNLQDMGIINALGEEVNNFKRSSGCIWGTSQLSHEGADSFWGHYEIVGAKLKNPIIEPFSYNLNKIKHLLSLLSYKVKIEEKFGLQYLVIDDSIIISDNIEAEYGQVYSVVGSYKSTNYETILGIAKLMRDEVKVSRVVAVGCDIELRELKESMEKKENKYLGINAPSCNLYNRNYRVEHLGYGVSDEKHVVTLLRKHNINVTLIGKVADIIKNTDVKKIFGIRSSELLEATLKEMDILKEGLIITNVQETDLAGHLQQFNTYGKVLEEVDDYIGKIKNKMSSEDLLIVAADHGNDPTIGHAKHTREKVPVLISYTDLGKKEIFIGERKTLGDIGQTISQYFNIDKVESGEGFISFIKSNN